MEQISAPGSMTQKKLVAALQDECRIDKLKAEDFLNALYDLAVETLSAGCPFAIGGIGTIAPRRSGKAPAILFIASKQLRTAAGLPEKYDGPLCKDCQKNPRAPRRPDCHACKKRKERAKKHKR